MFKKLFTSFKRNISNYNTIPQTKQTIEALWNVQKIIFETLDFNQVVQKIVDSILVNLGYLQLGYKIMVLILYDKDKNILKRVSISQTEEAKKALSVSPLPFSTINIPMESKNNICVKVFNEQKPAFTTHWPDILSPAFKDEDALAIQKIVGIHTSLIYPIISKNESLGVLIFSMVKAESEVSEEERNLIAGFSDIVGLAVQNSKLYSSLDETSKRLQLANSQLKELDKIKDEFVYMASHELRTPMTAIKNYLWLALNKHRDQLGDELKKDLDRAYLSTERLIGLVQDMLTVSRIEGNRMVFDLKPLNIFECAKEIVNELGISATGKNLKLILVPSEETCVAMADQTKVMEVVQNLIGNSLKFTPSGGTITVATRCKNGTIETSVSDTGVGIPKEDMPRLFQKFGRLGHSYKRMTGETGTGLGLFISKQIVEALHGKIWADSVVDQGTTFTFSLPEYNENKPDGDTVQASQTTIEGLTNTT
jgi:signal transduction histidine kinase